MIEICVCGGKISWFNRAFSYVIWIFDFYVHGTSCKIWPPRPGPGIRPDVGFYLDVAFDPALVFCACCLLKTLLLHVKFLDLCPVPAGITPPVRDPGIPLLP